MSAMTKLRSLFGVMIVLVGQATLQAQMTVKQDRQPTQLVKEVLIGNGVLVDNVHFMGMIAALGEFTNPSAQPFFSSGIVLSTGAAMDMAGPNDNPKTSTVNGSPGDKNLYPLAGGRTFDGAKLAFDFKADKDSVAFNFFFASEEYNDYVGSTFNDVFALVVTGPGFGNGKNLAVLPGTTTPITVNSINPNQNRQYFVDNNPYTLVGRINETAKANLNPTTFANFEYDGMTKVFSVGFRVVPKTVYHFEIVVSDAGDGTVDSAVLLEGGSFKSLEQQKHALRRQQIAEQRRADSLARVQVTIDSLAEAAAIADSIESVNRFRQAELAKDEMRIRNLARLDSIANNDLMLREAKEKEDRAREEQIKEAQRQDSLRKAQAEESRLKTAQLRIQDSLENAKTVANYSALVAQQRQDSLNAAKQQQARLAMARQAHDDSLAKTKQQLPPAPKVVDVSTPAAAAASEMKETILFEATSYFVPSTGEGRLHELGQLLAKQPELRAGIYLPQGEPIDVLNMRYDMMRFELLKAGAKTHQIFRNGFSFAAPGTPKNIQRAEIWVRKEQ